MYFKLALKNVKKSFKDYTIYFLTLTFAVCIFYAFNSMDNQKAIFEITESQINYMQLMEQMMGIVSVFVSLILGGLIVYGNRFLVKRRKKELGIYMTLGMARRKIATLLFFETVIIGVLALGVGLVLGVMGSQALSLLVAKLFMFDMSQYAFSFSVVALWKSIAYFGVIFVVVMLLNTAAISKYQLIDLLQAARRNEEWQMGKTWGSAVVLGIGVVLIGTAYYLATKVGLRVEESRLWLGVALGAIGTYGFFYGLSGCLWRWAKNHPKLYYKNLNLFVTRQLHRHIHTNILSMTVICLMLFLTITGLSTGLSFKQTMEKGLAQTTPFDASAHIYYSEGEVVQDVEQTLGSLGVGFEGSEDYAVYHEYRGAVNLGDWLGEASGIWENVTIYGVPISEYNEMRKLSGQEPVDLDPQEIIISSNQSQMIPAIEAAIKEGHTLTWNGVNYRVSSLGVQKEALTTTGFSNNFMTVIVPDEAVIGIQAVSSNMNISYGEDNPAGSETKFQEVFNSFKNGEYKGEKIDYTQTSFVVGDTKLLIYENFQGVSVTILFVGIYIGVIFLISSAAVLALQQLSEASDSLERYETLKKIGATQQMIQRSILIQTAFYFGLPLMLAVIHGIVGINIISDFLRLFNQPDIGGSSLMTLWVIVSVYGAYFYATYCGYKGIVLTKKQ